MHYWKLLKSCSGNKPEKHVVYIIFVVRWLFMGVMNILKCQCQIYKPISKQEITLFIYKDGVM